MAPVALAITLLAGPALAQPAGDAARPADPGMTLTLAEALRAAEAASESLAVARSEVDRAQAQVEGARSGYLPRIDGSAGYSRTLASEFDDISFGPPPTGTQEEIDLPFGQPNTWRLGVTASQPLFDGFRTSAAVAQAKAGVRTSQLGVRSTRAQIVLQVAQAYYDAALAQRQVEISEVTLKQAQETFATTQLNFKQGAAPEFDLVRAEVARDNQSTLLVQFRAQRDVAFVQLRRLIGARLDRSVTLTTKLEGDDVDTVVTTARTAAGLGLGSDAARLALAQAREAVAIRAASVRIARADRLPQIVAVTDFGLVNYERQPFTDAWRTNWTVGISLSVPIFDGLRRRAAIRTSAAELAGARAQLAQGTEISDVEVAQASANVAAATTTLETSTRTVGQARRAYEIAELRFEQGASTHLELVDARVQLEQALLNQARSARDLRVARLRQELLPGLPLGATGAATGF
ncbi:MAG: TolC family protein [Deltaproteobacteria bacterium]|nr:TolC family protein [Deltaproteobacteria bacterium]